MPRQLTYYPARGPLPPRWGYDNQVYGWTPDGKAVVFRSLRDNWDLGQNRLYTVPLEGGLPTALPMPQSGAGDLSPDGKSAGYSPLFRDFRAWKRYQGGWAEDLWVFDLATHDAKNVTNNPFSDRDPMWIGDRIYFASDRSGTLNLYTVRPDGTDLVQLTHSTTWDVRWPSADEAGHIVYEQDGALHVFDTGSKTDRKLDILVPDDGLAARPQHRANLRAEDLGPVETDAQRPPAEERVRFRLGRERRRELVAAHVIAAHHHRLPGEALPDARVVGRLLVLVRQLGPAQDHELGAHQPHALRAVLRGGFQLVGQVHIAPQHDALAVAVFDHGAAPPGSPPVTPARIASMWENGAR